MAKQHTEEFKRDSVLIALTSGLTRNQVASDLNVGLSTLGKWIRQFQMDEEATVPDPDLLKEVERLRKENSILTQEGDILKKAAAFFAAQK